MRERLKIFRQRVSRHPAIHTLAGFLLSSYIRLVLATSRSTVEQHPDATPYANGEKKCLMTFWHGRLVLIPPHKPPKRPMHVMMSKHNDGELIARTVRWFGIKAVRGSTGKGGMLAGRDVIRLSRRGENIAITPDGPRGPNRIVQAGTMHIARMCDAAILPISYSSSRHKALQSWDRMQIPLPFGHIYTCIGAPVHVPRDADEATMETLRADVEDTLNALTIHADRLAGCSEERIAAYATQRKAKRR